MSVFILTSLFTGRFIVFADSKIFPGIAFLMILFLSLYGLTVLKKKFEFTILENNFTKDENIEIIKFVLVSLNISETSSVSDYAHFRFKDSLWSFFIADIHLFADNHFIAVNVRDFRGGFADFGRCKSTEEMIERLILQASC